MWKVPTGLADKGETIKMAVERELREETGVKGDFKGIISFREAFPMTFGFSDIYFNCLLIADENQKLVKNHEFSELEWKTLEFFQNLDYKFSAVNFQKKFLEKLKNQNLEEILVLQKYPYNINKKTNIYHIPKIYDIPQELLPKM